MSILEGNVTGSVSGSINLNGEGGTDDYRELTYKPSINNVVLDGDLTSEDLGIPTDAVTDVKVDGFSVVTGGVADITLPEIPVQDVKVDGTSVVNAAGTANITMPTIPVQDVEVNGSSVVTGGVANVNVPPQSVTDVRQDGVSVMTGTIANITTPSIPVQDVEVNGSSVMVGSTAEVTIPVTDVEVDGVSVLNGTVAEITSPTIPVTDVELNGTSVLNGTVAEIDPTAADVSYDNTVSGMTATDCQDAIDELKSSLITLTKVTKTIDCTSYLANPASYNGAYVYTNDADFSGARYIIPLGARKSGSGYLVTVAVDTQAIRLCCIASQTDVVVDLLIVR